MYTNALRAGVWYFASIFALGFVLGTIRILLLAPIAGETAAVLIESPVILTASWFAGRYFIKRLGVTSHVASRALMGLCAFALLIVAEALLAIYGFGQAADEFLRNFRTVAGGAGLFGQILFGLFPLIDVFVRRRG